MPLVEFLKPYAEHKVGDKLVIDPGDAEFLKTKAIVKELPTSELDGLIKKAFEENMAVAIPQFTKGMTDTFGAMFEQFKENAKKMSPAQVKFHDSPDIVEGSSMVRKSADEVMWPQRYVQKSWPGRKATQDVFKNIGHFARTVVRFKRGMADNSEREELVKYEELVKKSEDYIGLTTKADPTGMGEALASDGGFLVPPEFSMQILERVYSNPLLAMTDSYPIAGNQITFHAVAERSRVDGSRQGGVRGYWKDEAQQYTGSKPTLRELKLEPHKLTIMVHITDELMQDSAVAPAQFVTSKGAEEINFKVGDALYRGTGSGQPLGILNAPCLITVSKETGQAASTIVTENIDKMWMRMDARHRPNAIWLYNQDIEQQLSTLQLATGASSGQLVYMPPGGISGAPYATLKGRPMLPLEFCATLGTVGDLVLVDMSAVLSCVRGGLATAVSPHLRFDYDEQVIKMSFRVDARPWWDSSLTPFQGSNTTSPFIALATRA